MTSTLPAGRYSARRRPAGSRRRSTAIVLALGIIAGAVVAVIAYRNLGSAPISGEQTGFSVDSPSAVTVQYTVTRNDPSKAAVCILQALSLDGSETGRREMYIPPSASSVSFYKATVHTSHPPVAGSVFGCSYTVPSYLQPS